MNKISVANVHSHVGDSAAVVIEEDEVGGHEFVAGNLYAVASHVGGVAVKGDAVGTEKVYHKAGAVEAVGACAAPKISCA